MSMPTPKLEWPKDAVIVVAADRGTENRSNMEAVVYCSCRRCGQPLGCDTATLLKCVHVEGRGGRPIDFFCVKCCLLHDRGKVDVFEDHRYGKTQVVTIDPT